MTPLHSRMLEELQVRNLSRHTAHTYVAAVERFAIISISPRKDWLDCLEQLQVLPS
jgi:hypothetical protein